MVLLIKKERFILRGLMDREYSLDFCGLEKETLPPVLSFYTRMFEMDVLWEAREREQIIELQDRDA